ncbi:hypothetical protein ACFQ0Q_31250 [Streptomyces aureus]
MQRRPAGWREEFDAARRGDGGGKSVDGLLAAEVLPRLPLAAHALAPQMHAAGAVADEDVDRAGGVGHPGRTAELARRLGVLVRVAEAAPLESGRPVWYWMACTMSTVTVPSARRLARLPRRWT